MTYFLGLTFYLWYRNCL